MRTGPGEPESRYYESQRLRMHYVVWAGSGGPPLLLIHGGREHCRSWDFVARALSGRYTIYALDMRGHGDSQWVIGGPYNLPGSVADVAALASTLEGPITIIGHSRGGNVALHYAGVYPERVARVVAIEGLGPPPPEDDGPDGAPAAVRMRHWIERMRDMERRRPRLYASLEDATQRIMEEDHRVAPDVARHFAVHGTRRNEDGTYFWKFDNYVRAGGFYGDGGQEIWSSIQAPVLLVTGSESWACDPKWQERRRAIPGHRTALIEGAGHWVHHDQLGRFLEVVQPFLAEE